jgi:hypothetical protein
VQIMMNSDPDPQHWLLGIKAGVFFITASSVCRQVDIRTRPNLSDTVIVAKFAAIVGLITCFRCNLCFKNLI